MTRLRVLGMDPGFANFGWCAMELCYETGPRALLAGVILTAKENKKQNLYTAHDNVRRARTISRVLGEIIDGLEVRALCAESMSFPRSSSVAAKVALAWGVISAHAERAQLPIVSLSPQAIKLSVAGSRDASKEAVARAVRGRTSGIVIEVGGVPKSKQEHAYDAAASVLAAVDSDVINAMLQGRK